jgi:hypothetical protein
LKRRGCKAYVKYNSFDQEQKRKRKDSALRITDFDYDKKTDRYTCPEGQRLTRAGSQKRRGEEVRIYEARNCATCPRKAKCSPKYDTRRLFVNNGVEPYRRQARVLLNSPPGRDYRSRRLIEAEAVFGQIKHNGNFRRCLLRGLDKVKTEFHLVALAHNLKKLWATTAPCPA